MRARIKTKQPILCCEARERDAGLVITITGKPQLLEWHCPDCDASGERMTYAVVGQDFGRAHVDGIDIDEGGEL